MISSIFCIEVAKNLRGEWMSSAKEGEAACNSDAESRQQLHSLLPSRVTPGLWCVGVAVLPLGSSLRPLTGVIAAVDDRGRKKWPASNTQGGLSSPTSFKVASTMCLAAIALGQSQRFPWVLASNRDEYFRRPAMPLAWWRPPGGGPAVLSGRDLTAGGTWLGLNGSGCLALLTNVREPLQAPVALPSRGELVLQWLSLQAHNNAEAASPDQVDALLALATVPRQGFNLFTARLSEGGMPDGLPPSGRWLSNRPVPMQGHVSAGIFGLSNAAWDTPWPKVQGLKKRLADALGAQLDDQGLLEAAFDALADPAPASDDQLPRTGVSLARERQLSSAFIRIALDPGGIYGTRCSTVVLVEQSGTRQQVRVVERSFDESGSISGQCEQRLDLSAASA